MTPEQRTGLEKNLRRHIRRAAEDLAKAIETSSELRVELAKSEEVAALARTDIDTYQAALDALCASTEPDDPPPCATGMVIDGQPPTYPDDDWTHGCGRYG